MEICIVERLSIPPDCLTTGGLTATKFKKGDIMTKDFGDQMLEQSDLHFAELNQDLRPCTITLNDDTEIQGECEWVEPYQESDRLECIHVYHLDGTRIPSDMYKRIVTI